MSLSELDPSLFQKVVGSQAWWITPCISLVTGISSLGMNMWPQQSQRDTRQFFLRLPESCVSLPSGLERTYILELPQTLIHRRSNTCKWSKSKKATSIHIEKDKLGSKGSVWIPVANKVWDMTVSRLFSCFPINSLGLDLPLLASKRTLTNS